MKKEKSDIRIRFTKKMIQESLIELMTEKSILNITIKEICECAGVSRSTFYTYYSDQYDLLKQIEHQTFSGMDQLIQQYRREYINTGTINPVGLEKTLQGYLQYIADNNNSIQVLLSENGDQLFQKRFFRNNIEHFRIFKEIKRKTEMDDETLKCYSLFTTGGFLVLIQDWLKNGMNIPAQKIVNVMVGFMQWIFK